MKARRESESARRRVKSAKIMALRKWSGGVVAWRRRAEEKAIIGGRACGYKYLVCCGARKYLLAYQYLYIIISFIYNIISRKKISAWKEKYKKAASSYHKAKKRKKSEKAGEEKAKYLIISYKARRRIIWTAKRTIAHALMKASKMSNSVYLKKPAKISLSSPESGSSYRPHMAYHNVMAWRKIMAWK